MKKILCAIILGGLVSTALSTPFPSKSGQVASAVSIGDVLQAHNVPKKSHTLSEWAADAVRVRYYPVDSGRGLPGFFERNVSVSVSGGAFRRDKTDPLGLRKEIDMFDGRGAYHTTIEEGAQVEGAEMGDSGRLAVESAVRAFGLIPTLKQLSDPAVNVVYIGQATGMLDRFDIRTADRPWTVYADRTHLIRRLDFEAATIEFADYRSVDGVQLPFFERLSANGRLVYELVFTRIDLKPSFPRTCFDREALAK